MIDVVFNLLIFFLLGSSYIQEEQNLPLQLPQVGRAQPITEGPVDLVLNVNSSGEVSLGTEPLSRQALRDKLMAALKNYPDQGLSIRGDRSVRYESIAELVSMSKDLGFKRLDLLVHEQ